MSSLPDLATAAREDLRLSRWKSLSGMAAAILLSLIFLVSGVWKLTDLDATAERMVQALVPVSLSMPAAFSVAVTEVFAGVLLLVPRFRRWGALLAGLMLLAFMVYIGALYDRLLGDECNCFPWLERIVGPAFFAGDAAMLALAVVAGWWARRSSGWRPAAAILCGLLVLGGASYATSLVRRGHADVPESAMVEGKLLSLRQGRILLYFFDPECTHCLGVARAMSKHRWGGTRLVAVPTREPQFAVDFLEYASLAAAVSPDAAALRQSLPFGDPPYAVAVDTGKVVATFNSGEMEQPGYFETLRRLGFVE